MPDRPPGNYLNWCRSCKTDFASVRAFDQHRVGEHAYTFAEGLALDPPREDGRRCLDAEEMAAHGLELDEHGRWRMEMTEKKRASLERSFGTSRRSG